MTTKSRAQRPPVAARRAGYLIAAALTAGFWYLLNVRPGWSAAPFLTADAARVIGLMNLSLAVGFAANLLYVGYDAPWWRSVGDLATTGIGLAVLVRVWQVFPFRFTGSFDWPLLVRMVLVVAMAGSVLGILVAVVTLVRRLLHHGPAATHPG